MKDQLKNFSTLLRSKKQLMTCIFLTLIVQITVAIGIIKFDEKHHLLGELTLLKSIGILVACLSLIFMMSSSKISFTTKQFLFIIFSILNGLLLSVTIQIINDKGIVETAALSTLINFLLMLVFGIIIVYFGYDLSWLGIYLFIALLIAITILIITMFAPQSKEMNKKISIGIILLFSLFILFDTNNILLKYGNKNKSDCIHGALSYYLDILNLFSNYLRIDS